MEQSTPKNPNEHKSYLTLKSEFFKRRDEIARDVIAVANSLKVDNAEGESSLLNIDRAINSTFLNSWINMHTLRELCVEKFDNVVGTFARSSRQSRVYYLTTEAAFHMYLNSQQDLKARRKMGWDESYKKDYPNMDVRNDPYNRYDDYNDEENLSP